MRVLGLLLFTWLVGFRMPGFRVGRVICYIACRAQDVQGFWV